ACGASSNARSPRRSRPARCSAWRRSVSRISSSRSRPSRSRGRSSVQGTFLGRYRIDAKLGEGGVGVVGRAHDPRLRRDGPLKVLPDALVGDEEARTRLLKEARAAAALNHPHILTVYDVGEAGGHVYLAMEYVPGRPLSEVIGS